MVSFDDMDECPGAKLFIETHLGIPDDESFMYNSSHLGARAVGRVKVV